MDVLVFYMYSENMRPTLLGALILFSHQLNSMECSKGEVGIMNFEDYDDYVLLASDIQDYSLASSVFIIFGGNDESLDATTLMLHLRRKFSGKLVLSLTANYTDIIEYSKIYYKRIIRPLFVVLLNSEEEVNIFQGTTQIYDMSFPTWLVIFMDSKIQYCKRPKGNMFNLKFDAKMLVKCYGDPNLREWYSMHESKTEIYDLARWDLIRHFQLKTNKSLYERRHSIGGKVLRVATVNESPFIASKSGLMQGPFGRILEELASAMNFTYNHTYEKNAYGIWNKTAKSWTGVMGLLIKRKVDIGVAEFTMTGQRLDEVDFSLPLILSRNLLYMRQPDGSVVHWSSYYRAFDSGIWLFLILVYIVSSFIITIMRLKIKEKPIPPDHISENYLWVWGIFCQQGLSDFPIASPLRIAYFSLFVSSLILLAIYSASLISYLTITIPSLPFKDLEGFANDGSYKLVAFQESADYDMFATSKDRTLKKMMKRMKSKTELPTTMMAGFKQACAGNKVAFYATEAVKNQINARLPCKLVSIDSGRIDSLGLVLPKKSPYRGLIDYNLQKFKDCGIMTRLKRRFYARRDALPDSEHDPVGIRGIVPILTLLGAGIFLGFIIFMYEKLCYRMKYSLGKRKILKGYRNRSLTTARMLINDKYYEECSANHLNY